MAGAPVSARRGGALAVALALIASIGIAIAQEGSEAPSSVDERQRRLEAFDPDSAAADQAGPDPSLGDLALPDAPDPASASAQTTEAYQATLQAYYAYRKAGYEHRLGVFDWQSLSTKVIFVVVLLLVLAGIYFAAIQFHAGLRRRDGDPAHPEETELSLSLSEVKVRSPVLGVIILTISLAFFYLYLVHVYPIRNVF
jgi:hypothetical protein